MYALAVAEEKAQSFADSLDGTFDVGNRKRTHALDRLRQLIGVDGLDIDCPGM